VLPGRVDIRIGVGRRRRWSGEGRIIAQSYAPGALVPELARWHDMSPQQLCLAGARRRGPVC